MKIRSLVWRVIRHSPVTFGGGWALFMLFFTLPAGIGWVLSRAFAALESGDGDAVFRAQCGKIQRRHDRYHGCR